MTLSWANRITILRILLIAPFVICMLQINDPELSERIRHLIRYSAVAIFFLMAISDGIDGYLARKNGETTRLGTFLDPTADKLLITSASLLLASYHAGVAGFILPPTVVVLIIGKDVLIFIGFLIVYFLTGKVLVVPVFAGKASTALTAFYGSGDSNRAGGLIRFSRLGLFCAGLVVVGGRRGVDCHACLYPRRLQIHRTIRAAQRALIAYSGQ